MDTPADCSCDLPHCRKNSGKIPLESILAECDVHFNSGNPAAVGETLRRALTLAQESGDAQSELTLLNELMAKNALKVVALYPDQDITLWKSHPLPKGWINGYDYGCQVEKNRTYDLRAIPALYLLNSEKKVLVKDSTSIPQIEQVLLQLMQ